MEITPSSLRSEREKPVVLKVLLSQLRSYRPSALVFVLEGKEDLRAYETWIQRCAPEVSWEPLVANGKRNALAFRAMLSRDETGLKACTNFIVDHDYDGLAGYFDGADIYVLPAHSIENILADEAVVESILKTEFRVLGNPDARDDLVKMYVAARSEFCKILTPPCEVLAATRQDAVGEVTIRENCLEYIQIAPNEVLCINQDGVSKLVTTEQDLAAASLNRARDFFRDCPIALWLRGKYIAAFFRVWGVSLMEDRRSSTPRFFSNASSGHSLSGEWNEIGSLAAKSPIPVGLAEFVQLAFRECEHGGLRAGLVA